MGFSVSKNTNENDDESDDESEYESDESPSRNLLPRSETAVGWVLPSISSKVGDRGRRGDDTPQTRLPYDISDDDNGYNLPDQLCAKVAQYITPCNCDEYPKIKFKLQKTNSRFYIDFYVYPSKGTCFHKNYMIFDCSCGKTMFKKVTSYNMYVLKAIVGINQSNLRPHEFKHPGGLVHFTKNRLNVNITHSDRKYDAGFYNNIIYCYKCKITPKLKENVKQILNDITA